METMIGWEARIASIQTLFQFGIIEEISMWALTAKVNMLHSEELIQLHNSQIQPLNGLETLLTLNNGISVANKLNIGKLHETSG